ncbi:MAG TPA: YihY/virulence factor BrkB family protein [Caulobacteraceae bacterium]|nr:YihY/virulence factor BrkB family protein [Caulobacteraceae bacterium]
MTRSPRAPKTPPGPAQRVGSWLAATAGAAWRRLRGRRAEPHSDLLTPEDYDAAEPGRGRAAAAPWLIQPRGWKDIAWRTWHEIGRARLAVQAGGVSFYLMLATFPAIAASVSLFGLFSNVATVEQQFLHFSTMFPSEAIDFLGDQMVRLAGQEHGTLGVAFVVSAALSIWSAKAGMQALFDGVNLAYNETEKRPFLKRALLTYAATLVAILFIVSTTSVALAVPEVLHAIGWHRIVLWWGPVRWLAILAAAVVAFTLVYRFGPSRRPARWRWVAAGGLFAAVAWMAGSFVFSWYLNSFTHLGVTYGSLGAMIGFMLWMWLSVLIVLVGAELNAEIEHQTACDTTVGAERPLGERGAVVADTVGGAFPMSPREMREKLGAWILREIRGAFREVRRALRLER